MTGALSPTSTTIGDGPARPSKNSNGPHTTKDFPDKSITVQQAHVQFVYVRVLACNPFGCSTGQNSLKHYNPF